MRPSLIAGGFFALTELVPSWRTPLWRFWYNTLATQDTANLLPFMNYGYDDGASRPPLQEADEAFRPAIQLYAATLRGVEVGGKDVLEVGSGRGGGGSYILRYCAPNSYTGVDLSLAAIERCRRELALAKARWVQGCADALPVESSSADIVLNVESSHSYPSMVSFLKEVCRVLRPGGYFAFADVRKTDQVPELEEHFDGSGLAHVDRSQITQHVLRALDQ